MGADGKIKIWRDSEAREAFPDCGKLFSYLPTHYLHSLDGVQYHHCYSGDNLISCWADVADSYAPDDIRPRLQEFIDWLDTHGTEWEVWT